MAPLDPAPRLGRLVRRTRHDHTGDLVRQIDVAAVGFAVSLPGTETRRLIIVRKRNGKWKVDDDSDLRGIPEKLRQRAISISAAVICGSNLYGNLMTELEIHDEVRWVRVSRPGAQKTSHSKRSVSRHE